MNEYFTTFDKSFDAASINSYGEDSVEENISFQLEGSVNSDYLQLGRGRHIQSFSARVLDWDDDFVKTEFLINKDEGLYQTRFFPIDMFENTNFLQHNKLLKAFLFIKRGESSLKFEDGKGLVQKEDFQDNDSLTSLDSPLFKFK